MPSISYVDQQIIHAVSVLDHEGCLRTKTIFNGGGPFFWKRPIPVAVLYAVLTPNDLASGTEPMAVIDARVRYLHDMKHITVTRKRISPKGGSFRLDECYAEVISVSTGDEVRDDSFRSIFGKAPAAAGWHIGVRCCDGTPRVLSWSATHGQIFTIDDVLCIQPGERWHEAFKDGAVGREKRRRVQAGQQGQKVDDDLARLRAAIQQSEHGLETKVSAILRSTGIEDGLGRKLLRQLQEAGDYNGYTRKRSTR